ncbi:hypothetical protein SRABI130_04981 [Pseudomonas sp. Bi130]|nr:hypothetical protein SRABI130_04981 [Pseudomonas sp. Bi130]
MSKLEKRSKVGVRIALTIVLLLTCIVFLLALSCILELHHKKPLATPIPANLSFMYYFQPHQFLLAL